MILSGVNWQLNENSSAKIRGYLSTIDMGISENSQQKKRKKEKGSDLILTFLFVNSDGNHNLNGKESQCVMLKG